MQNEKGKYYMSVVRQHGIDWEPLTGNEVGPADRNTNVMRGAGGYVSTFSSGETVLSCNIGYKFSLKLGNHTGTEFNGGAWESGWLNIFGGYWGSTEVIESHRLLATVHCKKGVQYAICHLNHDISAHHATIKIDGKGNEWTGDEALFIGSETPSQAIIRASQDSENLYLLVECKSEDIDAEMELRLGNLPKFSVWSNGYDKSIAKSFGIKVKSRKGVTERGERGFISEISIPKSSFKGDIASIPLWVSLNAEGKRDTFFNNTLPHILLGGF